MKVAGGILGEVINLFDSYLGETAELFSCRNCIHFDSVYREDGCVYTVDTEIILLLRNRYDQVLQSYYSICAFLGITLWVTGSNGRLVYSKGGMGVVC